MGLSHFFNFWHHWGGCIYSSRFSMSVRRAVATNAELVAKRFEFYELHQIFKLFPSNPFRLSPFDLIGTSMRFSCLSLFAFLYLVHLSQKFILIPLLHRISGKFVQGFWKLDFLALSHFFEFFELSQIFEFFGLSHFF